MRPLCSCTLLMEALVICFAGLVAMRMTDVPSGTVWAVAGPGAVLCLLLCGVLDRRWAVPVGWLVQAGVIVSGLLVPMMYVLGACFGGLWYASVRVGRKVDAVKAERARMQREAEEGGDTPGDAGLPHGSGGGAGRAPSPAGS